MGPGWRLRFHAKRKAGQVIENKQLREMAHFVPIMISTAYGQRRETARFARRKNPFAFAGFSASSRPKTQGSEINGGFGGARGGRSATRRLGTGAASRWNRSKRTRKWRRLLQPLGENRAGWRGEGRGRGRDGGLRRFAHNLRRESIFFIFSLITL
jgi:hypothetical protein